MEDGFQKTHALYLGGSSHHTFLFCFVGRYAWDQPVRFALSPEEAGSLIAKLPRLESVELARRTPMGPMQKVFRAVPRPDGSVQFVVDYELEGEGGQEPPSEKEAVRQ